MQHIAVEIPKSDGYQAALDAARTNARDDCQVHLFHNVYHENIIDQHGAGDQVLEEARNLLMNARKDRLNALAAKYFAGRADTRLAWSNSSWQALIRFACEQHCNMVVAQTWRHTRWERLGLSNDDWELIRHCPFPLLLARDGVQRPYRRIIAAVDPLHVDDKPASLDEAIVRQAVQLANQHRASLSVINVVAPAMHVAPGPLATTPAAAMDQSEEIVAQHRAAVRQLESDVGQSFDDVIVVPGHPADTLVECATSTQADLVVMGAVSRSRLKRLVIGSTAERVLDRLPCDVLVVKQPEMSEVSPGVAALMSHA
ncbi:MAG: universal stress protein [Pseudomonadota bacterium]